DLGTIADFDAFVSRAQALDLEVAIDLALQASPDHPWVSKHPEWFTTRADGTIAYAENPPKKYQDIYPLNFDNDPEGIYAEILRLVRYWIGHGVTVFRVDNPHTKPLPFWERLLADIAKTDPDVIFLAEAFTRPAMMHALAAIGFHQSYTYFTWRNTAQEFIEYLTELSGPASAYMRPTFCADTFSTPARRLSKYGRCWPPCCRRPGASTQGSNWVRTRRFAPVAKSIWTRRSTNTSPETGWQPPMRTLRSRLLSRNSMRSGDHTPPYGSSVTCAFILRTSPRFCAFLREWVRRRPTCRPAIRFSSSSTSTRTIHAKPRSGWTGPRSASTPTRGSR